MRGKKSGLTPSQESQNLIMGWLWLMIEGRTEDLIDIDPRDSYRLRVRSALIRDYNRFAKKLGVDPYHDDLELPENIKGG